YRRVPSSAGTDRRTVGECGPARASAPPARGALAGGTPPSQGAAKETDMKALLKATGAAAALALLLTLLVPWTQAGGAKAPPSPQELPKARAEAGKPGAEHKKLQPFVGEWAFTMKVWTDPTQPPAELTGRIERKWIMDGRFVQEALRGACAKSGKT